MALEWWYDGRRVTRAEFVRLSCGRENPFWRRLVDARDASEARARWADDGGREPVKSEWVSREVSRET